MSSKMVLKAHKWSKKAFKIFRKLGTEKVGKIRVFYSTSEALFSMTRTSNFKNRDSFGILSSCSFYIWGWGFEFLQKIGSIVVPFFHSKLT